MRLHVGILICVVAVFLSVEIRCDIKKDKLKSTKLPPCQSCKILVESFKKGVEKTARGKFEGGDVAWEEEKLGSYTNSEVRLIEIQESLCADVERGQDQCHTIAENTEQLIEEWWFRQQKEFPDLQTWLCVEHLKHCCPENHFGPDCQKCFGYPNICNGNGKCKGSGTRKGNGKCTCDVGYSGEYCSICAVNYYETYRDSEKLLCTPCHVACEGTCTSSGAKGCAVCKKGWVMKAEKGCTDINECYADKAACTADQFCVNTEGSYSCLACDRSCSGCSGDGPDMCDKCAKGFELKDKLCMDTTSEKRSAHVTITRYLTYFGLCVATCIVLQSSTTSAALLGLCVAIYISVSEYMLQTTSPTPQIDPNSIDWGSLLNTQ